LSRDGREWKATLAELVSLSPFIVACVVGISLLVVEFGIYMGNPLVAFLLLYVVWITANYFFEIVEFKAMGHDDWPVFSIETLVARRNQVGVVFTLLVIAAGVGYIALLYLGWVTFAETLLGALLVVLPGSVALLAVTREYSAALHPAKVLAAVVGMGHAYFYCLGGTAAILVLFGLSQAHSLAWYFPLVYGLFLQAYLIGRVVYARRNVLGVRAPRSPEARAERERAEAVVIRNGILTHAYGLAAHGNTVGALRHIEGYLATDEDTLEARLWMLKEVARWENRRAALELGKRVAAYCDEHGLADEAARVRSMCEHLSAREAGAR
jgi:hypothetical protein